MAPPFLTLGVDSDDESKSVIDKLTDGPSAIPLSRPVLPRRSGDSDSDDDRSSISLSDMPINPPAPDFLLSFGRQRTREDEEKEPLSTPPSPFLSREIYMDCHHLALEQVGMTVMLVIFLISQFYCFNIFVIFVKGRRRKATRGSRNDGSIEESPHRDEQDRQRHFVQRG